MITAPIIILIYDRLVVADSFKQIWQQRQKLYVGLFASWLFLFALIFKQNYFKAFNSIETITTFQTGNSITAKASPLVYLLTQPQIILHYIKLSLWPTSLTLDYWWPFIHNVKESIPSTVTCIALMITPLLFVKKNPFLLFICLWFFIILSPTSSIFPLYTAAFEHRMYLPLISLIVLVVFAMEWLVITILRSFRHMKSVIKIVTTSLFGITILILALLTYQRNSVYASEVSIWSDTALKRPQNPRAYHHLGMSLIKAGKISESKEVFETSLKIDSRFSSSHLKLGEIAYKEEGNLNQALFHINEALRISSTDIASHFHLGNVYFIQGKYELALQEYEKVLKRNPKEYMTLHNIGAIYFKRYADIKKAKEYFLKSLEAYPNYKQAQDSLRKIELIQKQSGDVD